VRILGIDPGSRATGFGILECAGARIAHVVHGTIRPHRDGSLAARLAQLQRALREIIEQHRPDVASVEQVFVASSPRAALVLGQARGAILAALGEAGLTTREYAATQIKQAVTGSGRAAKPQMQRMVERLLALRSALEADAADALAAALCHAQRGRLGALEPLPRPRRGTRRGARFQIRRAP
jgi:crossover junction endodeoxyribonuclease RuvC